VSGGGGDAKSICGDYHVARVPSLCVAEWLHLVAAQHITHFFLPSIILHETCEAQASRRKSRSPAQWFTQPRHSCHHSTNLVHAPLLIADTETFSLHWRFSQRTKFVSLIFFIIYFALFTVNTSQDCDVAL
jgi:hypothetical protein